MEQILDTLQEFNTTSVVFRLVLALISGGVIGSERGRHGHPAGFRTHILVCLGATMAALVGLYTNYILEFNSDPLRVGAQVVSGIGFLGAGTILIRGGSKISGLTTAAALWATATIGLAIGVGFYSGSIVCTLIALLTTAFMSKLERNAKRRQETDHIYVELDDPRAVTELVDEIEKRFHLKGVNVTPPRSSIANHIGIDLVFYGDIKSDSKQIRGHLMRGKHTVYVVDCSL